MRNDRRRSRGSWITPVANMADVRTLTDALAFLAFWPSMALAGWMVWKLLRVMGVA